MNTSTTTDRSERLKALHEEASRLGVLVVDPPPAPPAARTPNPSQATTGGPVFIRLPQIHIGYGPLGHPLASVVAIGFDERDVDNEMWATLRRGKLQGHVPGVFFDENTDLKKQGYHVLRLMSDGNEFSKVELDPMMLARLGTPSNFTPRPDGEAGRKLADYASVLPSYVHTRDEREFKAGNNLCDHDFGLESYRTVFVTKEGVAVDPDDARHHGTVGGGFEDHITCTRCGAVHALPQQDD